MSRSRRFHFLLPSDFDADLRRFARSNGLGVAAALRQLATKALREEAARSANGYGESASTLATLVAAEHAVLMVASVLPEGERRMRELGPQAAIAAEARLAMFREPER
jgi:hypothetical protein